MKLTVRGGTWFAGKRVTRMVWLDNSRTRTAALRESVGTALGIAQPESELSQWYEARFGQGSSRVRRIGIVALARRLLVELWRYLETGAVPAGAAVKA